MNPPTKELHLRLSSLSNVAIVPPASHSLALPSVDAAPFITVPAKGPTNGAGFRSTRSQSDSMIIPYLSQSFAPCCGVDSERDARLREREEPGLMSMLVVTRLGGRDSPHPGDAFKSAAGRQHLT